MAANSGIEWTHHTFNPWWGCVKVSEACKNCYAERDSNRYGFKVWGPQAERRFFGEHQWNEPRRWNRAAEREGVRKRVFCASMADVFELLPEGHADGERMAQARHDLWALICATPSLDWLLLSKRPENAAELLPPAWMEKGLPDNVWVGSTVEDRKAVSRVYDLVKIPARVRFLSCEPLLENVACRLDASVVDVPWAGGEARGGRDYTPLMAFIRWVIVGGESGPGARPMHPDWARGLRDLCNRQRIAFHFKQWGEWAPGADHPLRITRGINTQNVSPHDGKDNCLARGAACMVRVGKKAAGRHLDGRTWDELPHPGGA